MGITHYNKEIWGIPNVLSEEICSDCIIVSEEENLFPKTLNGISLDIHTSIENRAYLNSPQLTQIIWDNIYDKIPIYHLRYKLSGINEEFRFYKYLTGQEFATHQDIDYVKSDNEKSFFSLLIYLNDSFIGGNTRFSEISVRPSVGSALIFPHILFHSGDKVTKGTKYVLRSDIMYKKI